jgi:aminoglycoside phosphotransferase (APT) family kinase protein
MLDRPGPVRDGEQLDTQRLQAYLLTRLPGASLPLKVEQFRRGYSNLTYSLKLGSLDLVLRRPPFGNPVKSAHDMGREFRVLSSLHAVYDPAPRPLLFCEDPEVIGDQFYVMERRHGVILRGPQASPQMAADPPLVRRVCESLIDNLVQLHSLDFKAAGLGDLGDANGYIDRQLNGWQKRYDKSRTDDLPDMQRMIDWLHENRPAGQRAALIHNDYKYDNLMLDPHQLTRIVAVLDWEMATIGDPLMDLGTALAYWVEAGDPPPLQAIAFGPTMVAGSLSRQQLVERYAKSSGTDVEQPSFFYAFGLYKLAVVVQQIYARYERGHTHDARFAELNQTVARLANVGVRAIESRSISACDW